MRNEDVGQVSEDETIRIVIAEDDPAARRALRVALRRSDMAVVAEATTGLEAVELTTFYRPDVLLMADRLPALAGIETIRQIHQRFEQVRIILLSEAPDDDLAVRALRAGACGYLTKAFDPETLPRIVLAATTGEAAISRRLTMRLVEAGWRSSHGGVGFRPVRSPLTDREWEVLDMITAGASTDEVARSLVLSTETVRSHLKNLYRKLGVSSRADAVEAANRERDRIDERLLG